MKINTTEGVPDHQASTAEDTKGKLWATEEISISKAEERRFRGQTSRTKESWKESIISNKIDQILMWDSIKNKQ